jgi:large subunit ribosomal protein L27Ae
MRRFHLTKNQHHRPTVNVESLWTLVTEQNRKAYEQGNASGKVPVIDTLAAGYGKVLGKGQLIAQPVIVKARFFSKTAEAKIKAAGGVCELIQ